MLQISIFNYFVYLRLHFLVQLTDKRDFSLLVYIKLDSLAVFRHETGQFDVSGLEVFDQLLS